MAVPVIGEACFELEPLAGEAVVIGGGADNLMHRAEGLVLRTPHPGFRGIAHRHGAIEMIGMNEEQSRVCRARRAIKNRDGQIIHPDIFPDGGSRRIHLGDDAVIVVMEQPRGSRTGLVLRDAARQTGFPVIDVIRPNRCPHSHPRDPSR